MQTDETISQAACDQPLHSGLLHDTDELCKAIFEQTRDGIFVADQLGQLLEVNQQLCRMLGYTHTELRQLPLSSLIQAEEAEGNPPRLKSLYSIQMIPTEQLLRCKDGHLLLVEVKTQLLADGRCLGFIHNITEYKQAENAQRALAENMAAAQRIAHFGSWEINVTAAGELCDPHLWSEECYRIFGFELGSEITTERYFSRIHPDDFKHLLHKATQDLQEGQGASYEHRILLPDGSCRYIHQQSILVLDEQTRLPIKIVGTVHDITEHKKTEIALRASEERYDLAVQGSQAGLWDWDLQTDEVYFSPRWKAILGYADDELSGSYDVWVTHLHPDDQLPVQASQRAYLAREKDSYATQCRMRHKDGSYRWILVRGVALFDAAGIPYRMAGSHVDITDQKLAEDALKVREEQLNYQANLLQNVTDAIIATDLNFHITSWNRGAELIYGQRADEVMGTDLRALVQDEKNPEQIDEALQHLWQLGSWKGEVTRKHKDGSTIYLLSSLSLLKDSAGAVVGTVSVNRNISKRRRAEESLRQSEERFDRAFHASPAALLIVHATEVCIIDVNDSFLHICAYEREEMIGRTPFELKLIIEVDETAKLIEQLRRQERVHDHEMPIRTKKGEIIQVSFSAEPVELDGENYILAMAVDITARKQAEERLRLALDATQLGVWEWEVQTNKLFWSPECYAIHGLQHQDDASSAIMDALHPEDAPRVLAELNRALANQKIYRAEFRILRPTGEVCWIAALGKASYDKSGNPLHMIGTIQNVTERVLAEEAQVQLEEQLRQAQKMETIGRLAGGVAHDFNNLLTVIQGYCDLILAKMAGDNPMRAKLEQIQKAGLRATTLTGQLLAFSRKQMLSPVVLDLNKLVANLQDMLERLIGEDILLTVLLQPDLWTVTADAGQLEQVIMNLVVNARDAMPTGGLLTIETSNVYRDDVHRTGSIKSDSAKAVPHEALTGPCIMVAVTDTGCGMDEQIRAHLFEPFFTTKEQGKGTGLGLATVYGIVKQSSGDIFVYSEVDQGSTFKIYLPATVATTEQQVVLLPQASPSLGNETILLVEDEEMVRKLVQTALEEEGYTILEARYADEALSLAAQYTGAIDLLMTDVVMPQISGRELAEHFLTVRPEMKVLFTSGYTDDAVVRHGLLTAEVEFLQKPFSSRALALKVREVLDK